jgi:hypothetical protein
MSAEVHAFTPAEDEAPEAKRRDSPQPEVPGRAPLCPTCWHLLDSLGHFWICRTRNGRLRYRSRGAA